MPALFFAYFSRRRHMFFTMGGMPMSKSFDCRLDVPYPEVAVEGRNISYAALLTNDLAGQVSEMTAVTQYVYQHMITMNERISETLMCISIVEMKHLEMIGEMIFDLGGNPEYAVRTGRGSYFWNARYVDYDQDPKRYLKINIAGEQAAIANYRKRIEQINDQYVRAVLERIILDEKYHIDIFGDLLAELGA